MHFAHSIFHLRFTLWQPFATCAILRAISYCCSFFSFFILECVWMFVLFISRSKGTKCADGYCLTTLFYEKTFLFLLLLCRNCKLYGFMHYSVNRSSAFNSTPFNVRKIALTLQWVLLCHPKSQVTFATL